MDDVTKTTKSFLSISIKYAVFFVIYNANDASQILIVKRPPDDENLPNVWGLPASSLSKDQSFHEALIKAGKIKLGVTLKPKEFIGRGNIQRQSYTLYGEEYVAEIVEGEPLVPQPEGNYVEWKWGTADDLVEAATKGSLCCNLYLQSLGKATYIEGL
jgi:ADP-ribose pyrophosphatase YjhB (NUDIX family)